MMGRFRFLLSLLPAVKRPTRRVGFAEKVFWTLLILVIYLIMSMVPLYGLPPRAAADPFGIFRVLFASRQGTLMELGIGPIVTAGLLLQLLVGARIWSLDFSKAEDRAVFTATNKLLAIVLTVFQASLVVLFWYGIRGMLVYVVVAQLVVAGILLILMDELLQEGWGLGSGISLFILAGVAEEVFLHCFSPIVVDDGKPFGAIPALIQSLLAGQGFLLDRSPHNFPTTVGLLSTVMAFLLVIYVTNVRVEIPVVHARFRGFRGRFPLRLLYVSVIPVIFTFILFTNLVLLATLAWNNLDRNSLLVRILGTFDERGLPAGGLAYYVRGPASPAEVLADPIRALVYTALFIACCVLFSITWVEVGGMDSATVADQIVKSGMLIPGFRISRSSIKAVLDRYIPAVTILGGLFVGALACVTQFLGAFGSGIGILLAVEIAYSYYQILVQERVAELYPSLRFLLGR